MQDNSTTYRYVTNPLKVWKRSDIWEHPQQIKIPFMKNLRAVLRWGVLTMYQCRIICFTIYYPKISMKIKRYRTIILPFVLYGCEAWSLTLRGGC